MASYAKRVTARGAVYDVRFMADVNGVRKLVHLSGFTSKREAEKAYRAHVASEGISSRAPEKGAGSVFESAVADYLEAKKGILSQGALYNLKHNFEKHITPAFSGRAVSSISKGDVVSWQSSLWSEQSASGAFLSNGTCKAVRGSFSGFMEWASLMYGFANPFEGLKSPHRREEARELSVWSVEEFNRFYEACAPSFRALFAVAFWSGARIGEVLALQRGDFELCGESWSIRISKSAQVGRTGFALVSPPKNSSSNRVVSLPAFLSPVVAELLEESTGAFVFGGEKPFCRARVSQAFNAGIELAGVSKIRVHDLRHSHASILIAMGVPIPAVSKRLGHSSVATTMNVYAHCLRETESALLAMLNSCAGSPSKVLQST